MSEPKLDSNQQEIAALQIIARKYNAELLFYNGGIDERFEYEIMEATKLRKDHNVLLCLCTLGGSAHVAYKVAKRLQRNYKKFILGAFGHCKSAGTLLAVGADLIIMGPRGEFGPLDVQTSDKEEINRTNSGLDMFEALNQIRAQHFEYYKSVLRDLLQKSRYSTKVAMAIAKDVACGFHEPIVAQIEPVGMGKTGRSIEIALQYGIRLTKENRGNISQNNLSHLVIGYPDHGFVIDTDESKKIFNNVREADDQDIYLSDFRNGLMVYPVSEGPGLIMCELPKDAANDQREDAGKLQQGVSESVPGEAGAGTENIQKYERKKELRAT